MTFSESCEQPVRSNAVQKAVGHSRLKMIVLFYVRQCGDTVRMML